MRLRIHELPPGGNGLAHHQFAPTLTSAIQAVVLLSARRHPAAEDTTRHSATLAAIMEHLLGATRPSNKELKLTKPGTIGASQLNSSVGRTSVGERGSNGANA
jgi:hypothetical protein